MKNYIIKPLICKPGIQRDGTPFATQNYIDGQWCRFYGGLPTKIGGYKIIDYGTNEPIESLFPVPGTGTTDVYMGRTSSIKYNTFDSNGNGIVEIDRTPSVFPLYPDTVWDIDQFTNEVGVDSSGSYIVAAAVRNKFDVNNQIEGNLYYGSTYDNLPLTEIINSDSTPVVASGGIVFAPPYMLAYGNNGLIQCSAPGLVNNWPVDNFINVSNSKVVNMYLTRGSGNSQLLAWTTNSVVLVSMTGTGSPPMSSSTIEEGISVISSRSIVKFDQQFFWIGIDKFYYFNGLVRVLDNTMSTNFFFNNVNLRYRGLIWGMVISKYNEVWWFYPRGDSTFCNAVIIYNVSLGVWFDSFISRAAGLAASSSLNYPIMSDSQVSKTPPARGVVPGYPLWLHEFGVDEQLGGVKFAIPSYFETNISTLFESEPQNNRLIRTRRIEPDFAQIGNMSVTVNNRMFASDSLENGRLLQTGPIQFGPDTAKIDEVNSQGRLVSYRFESNEIGGNYQAGKTLMDFEIGDINP